MTRRLRRSGGRESSHPVDVPISESEVSDVMHPVITETIHEVSSTLSSVTVPDTPDLSGDGDLHPIFRTPQTSTYQRSVVQPKKSSKRKQVVSSSSSDPDFVDDLNDTRLYAIHNDSSYVCSSDEEAEGSLQDDEGELSVSDIDDVLMGISETFHQQLGSGADVVAQWATRNKKRKKKKKERQREQ